MGDQSSPGKAGKEEAQPVAAGLPANFFAFTINIIIVLRTNAGKPAATASLFY